MKQDWTNFLAQQGFPDGFLDRGDIKGELASAQSATVIAPLADLGLIRVSGEEAATFLHNLLTNDVKGLPVGGARRSGFCSVKGRLLASLLMWHDGDDILLALSADLLPAILKKLSMYILRAKVKLADVSDDTVLLGLSGPNASAALEAIAMTPAAPLTVTGSEQGQVIGLGEQRYLLTIPSAGAPAAWQNLASHARPVGLAIWHWLDIVAGIPLVTAATQEEFLPQMVNFELIGGVSFNKGCYPGQEIVARTQYLGKVKRRMVRSHIEDGLPAPGNPLFAPETGDQACGMLVLVAPSPQGGHEALAVVQSNCFEGGEVHLGSPMGPLLRFLPLPYPLP